MQHASRVCSRFDSLAHGRLRNAYQAFLDRLHALVRRPEVQGAAGAPPCCLWPTLTRLAGAVLVSAVDALLQVSCFTAAPSPPFSEPTWVQCARAQQQGAFANELYGRVLEDMLCCKTFSAELLGVCSLSPAFCLLAHAQCAARNAGALASRYLQHPDVRYYTHTVLRRCELL